MLEGIGRVGAYVQQKNLKTAAKYRIKTGRSLLPSKTERLQSALKQISNNQSTKHSNPIRTASIKSKLRGGHRLTADEMSYLRENDPDLYRKAKGAQKAREELERDLSSCHTKAEARQALMRAQLKASNEAMAELSAAKGAGGAAVAGGANAASFSGDMGDISVDNAIGAEGASTDISAVGDMGSMTNGDVNLSGETTAIDPAASTATSEGSTNISADGEASDVNNQNISNDAMEKKEAENAAQQIISSVMREINNLMTEVAKADDSNEDESHNETSGITGNEPATNNTATQGGKASDATSDIIEKLLFKMRAIQNVWDEFTHSKEYKEMPEEYIDGDNKTSKPYKAKKSVADDAIMDIINQYTASLPDEGVFDAPSVDISQ
ncbi:hypothetical protein [Anaerovibrio sp.]|uniref:hypothetical protein n=1 Tax=Anaerovibrio sp. TaxID=1872532 RepID=UPI0025BB87D2|nr:hypothetical protein [Anaerovibrio sp.]MBR2142580.1 hypothetical protein [Anaerovibrio sp.]